MKRRPMPTLTALGHYPKVAARRLRTNLTPSSDVSRVLNDFAQNTTLLGLSHFLKKKSVIWFIAYFVCFTVSIAQSWRAGEDLFSRKSTQRIMIESIPKVPFPSVTFCSYALLPQSYDRGKLDGYNTSIDVDHSHCDDDSDIKDRIKYENDNIILRLMRTMSDEEREKLSVNMTSIILSCKFEDNECDYSSQTQFYFFNNPFYGNCFTFNPAFNSSGIEVDLTSSKCIFGDDRPKIAILLHTPGTAPVLESSSVSDFRPGDSVEYTLTMKLKNFRKDLSRGCVDREDESLIKRSKYYATKNPYLYSVDACMKSCAQDHTMKKCKKIDPILPVQLLENTSNITTEFPPISNCSILEGVDMATCGCPLPCKFIQYDVNPDTTKIDDECLISSKRIEPIKFSVNFLSTIVEVVEEEAAYSFTQFFGILGGNLSLWIGLCIISLLEIVELVWNLLKVLLNFRATRKINNHGKTFLIPPTNHGYR